MFSMSSYRSIAYTSSPHHFCPVPRESQLDRALMRTNGSRAFDQSSVTFPMEQGSMSTPSTNSKVQDHLKAEGSRMLASIAR